MCYNSVKEKARSAHPTNNIQNANHGISLETNTPYTAQREKTNWGTAQMPEVAVVPQRHQDSVEAGLQGNSKVLAPVTSLAQLAQHQKNLDKQQPLCHSSFIHVLETENPLDVLREFYSWMLTAIHEVTVIAAPSHHE